MIYESELKYMDFNRREFEGIVEYYYREYEGRIVRLDVSAGKAKNVASIKYKPEAYVLHLGIIETIVDERVDKTAERYIGLSDDDIAKAVSTVLEKSGFEVTGVRLNTVPVEGGIAFTGISVQGEKKKLQQSKEM